jgi:hypothetical protein
MTTTKEIADALEGIEYGELMTDEAERAKASGLVICYGASDDLVEFEGAIEDETCGPGDVYLTDTGLFHGTCDSMGCPHEVKICAESPRIRAVWHDKDGPCWTLETTIPHETFKVMEDGDVFCEGIVFRLVDIPLGRPTP